MLLLLTWAAPIGLYICDETKTKIKQNQNNSETIELPAALFLFNSSQFALVLSQFSFKFWF